ncbi:MAG: hypothetical protein KGM44_03050, partial [bacterium]|nr:hypothetical protein [bacterium]
MSIRVYDPRGSRQSARTSAAPRPGDLSGLHAIGLLDNSKEQAGVMLERVAHRLGASGTRALRAR